MSGGASEVLASQIATAGPVRFDRFMDVALYHPTAGFYSSSGGAGRGGADFITSPNVGPLFGAVLARYLDHVWESLGRPDPFTVIEGGAGRGTLARTIEHSEPACSSAWRYLTVERSTEARSAHPAFVTPIDDLPGKRIDGVVLANELLDNLAFRLLERRDGAWQEVHVDVADGRPGDHAKSPVFEELLRPLPAADAARVDSLTFAETPWPDGTRIPLQDEAAHWIGRARSLVRRGSIVVIDYGARTADLAKRGSDEWLRTYHDHQRGVSHLRGAGTQDITADVCVDQLLAHHPSAVVTTQADFLAQWGIDLLVDEGRHVWAERASIGDLAALRARSRVVEAEALTDPDGLGGFTVAEWTLSG